MIRTRRQRPPLVVHASVSDSTPIGRGRLAPAATPSAAPYASNRSQSSTWSGECVANTGFTASAARTPSHRDAASMPAAVSRCGCCRLIQPRSANAPKNAMSPAWNSQAAQVSRAGTSAAAVSTVKIAPPTASRDSPRACASETTPEMKPRIHRAESFCGPVVSASAGTTPSSAFARR